MTGSIWEHILTRWQGKAKTPGHGTEMKNIYISSSVVVGEYQDSNKISRFVCFFT